MQMRTARVRATGALKTLGLFARISFRSKKETTNPINEGIRRKTFAFFSLVSSARFLRIHYPASSSPPLFFIFFSFPFFLLYKCFSFSPFSSPLPPTKNKKKSYFPNLAYFRGEGEGNKRFFFSKRRMDDGQWSNYMAPLNHKNRDCFYGRRNIKYEKKIGANKRLVLRSGDPETYRQNNRRRAETDLSNMKKRGNSRFEEEK